MVQCPLALRRARREPRICASHGAGDRSYVFCATSESALQLAVERVIAALNHCHWQRLSTAEASHVAQAAELPPPCFRTISMQWSHVGPQLLQSQQHTPDV